MGAECVVCEKQVHSKDNDAFSTPCGHVFHKLCIYDYLFINSVCPFCKMPCMIKNLFQLYTNTNEEDDVEVKDEPDSKLEALLLEMNILTKQLQLKNERFAELSENVDEMSQKINFFESWNTDLHAENQVKEESITSIKNAYYQSNGFRY
ncbi:unnamed protein product [Diamesa serratosioi]